MNIIKMQTKYKILFGSVIFSILIFFISILFFNVEISFSDSRFFYLLVILTSLSLFPYLFFEYSINQKLKNMETMFPSFLKDLADNLNAGLNMTQSIKTITKTDYKELSSEILKLSNKLSWGVNFELALNEMIDDLNKSPIIVRGLTVLLQAFRSGGKVSEVMSRVADSTIALQNVEKSQESVMSQQAVIMYIIQIVFVAIIVVLFKVLIPITTGEGFGSELFGTTSGTTLTLDYYKSFFFVTLVVQSICSGFVAGIAATGKLIEGVKHVAIMLSLSILLFTIFVLPKTMQITVNSEKEILSVSEEFRLIGTVYSDDLKLADVPVRLYYNNQTFTGSTNDLGSFTFLITSPNKKGEYGGLIVANYEGKEMQTEFTFTVK